jgi:hypothetical protein
MTNAHGTVTVPETYADCVDTRFMTAEELGERKVTLRIAGVYREELADDEGGTKVKTTMEFARPSGEVIKKRLVMNRTNLDCLRALWGERVADWVGHRITIYAIPNAFRGKPGVRIWGSPELEADTVVTISLPRKKPFKMTLHKIERAPAPQQQESANG